VSADVFSSSVDGGVERRMEEVQDGRGVGERADVRMAWASRDDEGNGTESPTLLQHLRLGSRAE
jgi:hypothetical protein